MVRIFRGLSSSPQTIAKYAKQKNGLRDAGLWLRTGSGVWRPPGDRIHQIVQDYSRHVEVPVNPVIPAQNPLAGDRQNVESEWQLMVNLHLPFVRE